MDEHPPDDPGCAGHASEGLCAAQADCSAQGRCASHGGCAAQVSLDPRRLTVAERRYWLEQYRRHLEERLAEVNRQLADL